MNVPNSVFCSKCGTELMTIETDLNNRLGREITAECTIHNTSQGFGSST